MVCPRCKAEIYGPATAVGTLVKCLKCKKPFTAAKAPPEPPPAPRTIGQSVSGVAVPLFLLFLLSAISFAGHYAALDAGNPEAAAWFFFGGVLFGSMVPVTWFIWSLSCLRTIALCLTDASKDRFRRQSLHPE